MPLLHTHVRPKSRDEIATELQISNRTLRRRLKAAGIKLPTGMIYPQDQIRIYDLIYWPNNVDKLAYRKHRSDD